MEAEMVPGNEGGGVWEFKSKREMVKKMVRQLEKEESLLLDKDMGRLPRLEGCNQELCAESLEISESDNVIVCMMINETLSEKTRIQAHCWS